VYELRQNSFVRRKATKQYEAVGLQQQKAVKEVSFKSSEENNVTLLVTHWFVQIALGSCKRNSWRFQAQRQEERKARQQLE